MKNAILRFGRTCVCVTAAVLVMAGGLMAGTPGPIKVTLPHAVTVGSTTLPSGDYTISNLDISEGEYFVIRAADATAGTPVVTVQAMKINAAQTDKTQFIFSQDGSEWHFEKLFIRGDASGYLFLNAR